MGEKTGEYIYQVVQDCDGVYCYVKQGELVRCKDCKHGLKVVSPITGIFCTRFGVKDMAVEDDDYCSYGERGEADDE